MTFVFALDHPHELPPDEARSLVGGKAANLGVMSRELGLPVPPGFVITTEACRAYLAAGWPPGLDDELAAGMAGIEAATGRQFGGTANPLLVSVRSGAPISMPGMMDTILNIGVTTATAAALAATAGDDFARDCRDRLRQMFRAAAAGDPPEDPREQLRRAVEAVFRSWTSDRARAYRARERIPEDLGTAVTIQAMVFGNRDDRSATGVLFSRNPATGEPTLYGDVLFGAQGEDVVAGTHRTEPIAALDDRLPDVAHELRAHAARLECHYVDLCDIEFTIESGRLWLLQVRVGKRSPQAAVRMAVDMAEDPDFPLTREAAVRRVATLLASPPTMAVPRDARVAPLAVGLPASPGVATGAVVTSAEEAERAAAVGTAVVLVRTETSPKDVHGMAVAAGILTTRGGIASHAAVVARGWGIPAVVGADAVIVGPAGIEIAGRRIPAGETISIDGSTGQVFAGALATASATVPQAETLLGWAQDLGIAIGAPAQAPGDGRRPPEAPGGRPPPPSGAPSPEACLRAIGIKGFATLDAVAGAVGADQATTRRILDGLVEQGLAAESGGAYRLSDAGTARHRELVDADRRQVGPERMSGWLEAFLALDVRTKEAVTAWQLREAAPGGEPMLNDHADADYDAAVLRRLTDLAREVHGWLAGLEADAPRMGGYRRRLSAAAEAVRSGDHRFVASPRVDSFHGVWFELHEELILLAGRTRADEVAAGRA